MSLVRSPVRSLAALLVVGSVACSDDTTPERDTFDAAAIGTIQDASGADGTVTSAPDSAVVTADAGLDAELPDPEDAGLQTNDDAMVAPPPDANWDAAVPLAVLGQTYSATTYNVLEPSALAMAYNVLTGDTGSTRLFVNDIRASDAGTEVRYGAAAPGPDGGLQWQEASPVRTFRIAPSVGAPNTLVSEPFDYTLRARFTNGLGSFMLTLEAVNAIWTATASDDAAQLTDGTLYGVVTRTQAEARPLSLGLSCFLVCTVANACSTPPTTLAGVLDCSSTPQDADSDGDGTNDGYNLAIAFKSERIPFSQAGQ